LGSGAGAPDVVVDDVAVAGLPAVPLVAALPRLRVGGAGGEAGGRRQGDGRGEDQGAETPSAHVRFSFGVGVRTATPYRPRATLAVTARPVSRSVWGWCRGTVTCWRVWLMRNRASPRRTASTPRGACGSTGPAPAARAASPSRARSDAGSGRVET